MATKTAPKKPEAKKQTTPRKPVKRNRWGAVVMPPRMVKALQPYLPDLLKRYGEVAENGETERDDPLCQEAGLGKCYACAVFGSALTGRDYGCGKYMPPVPKSVDDREDGVYLVKAADRLPKEGLLTGRQRAQEWGAAVVEMLKSLQQDK